ncbi:hypothetical protein V8F06_011416 [Rhypophila decipiens]
MKPQEDIAVIGLSCRFPGEAATAQGFWSLLKNGLSGFSESTTRYNAEAFQHPQTQGTRQNVIPVKGGYFLKQDPYVFDAAFFNITATEAIALDPRQRIAMEVAYEALENAGITLSNVKGTQTSCFLGVSMSDYRDAISRDFGNFPKYQILGISDEMIANRISHFLDIHGPSATVQSACSSSLVAAHVACQSLRSGDANMAIAGGVGMITLTDGSMHLTNLGFLNPKGASRSFDADANGYGRGEGCGMVILKRLDDAIRDGDTIRAVIRGTGLNSDGWTQGVTMPSLEAQAALIKQVYEANGLDFSSTQYVEAHGTGTKVGDPIETEAIYSTIGQPSLNRKKLYVGSLKPNIGHLEAAAGVASIIKGVLSLERGLIPPNINFDKPNPKIPLNEWNMVVPTKLTPWPAAHTKRMSISGFGMGGTNGHVIMDAYTNPPHVQQSNGSHSHTPVSLTKKKRIFSLSSHDKAGFARLGQSLSSHLQSLGSGATSATYLASLSHTLSKARSDLLWRSATLASNTSELIDQLSSTNFGEDAIRTPASAPRIGLVFTGQGAQWAGMGVELLSSHPVFAASVSKSTEILKSLGCVWDAVEELSRSAADSRLGIPEISQPICTVLQIALVDELRSWGVKFTKVVGHSSGEIAAAYAIGVLSHADALAGAYFRGVASASLLSGSKKSQAGNGGGHGMMAVGLSKEEAQKVIKEGNVKGVTVACINSPSNVTLSGDAPALDGLKRLLDERGVFARRLKVQVAYHSPQMHLCSQDYYASIAHLDPILDAGEEQPKMISSVLGYQVDADQLGPYYWVQNLINPVQFTDALREMVAPEEDEDSSSTPEIDLLVEVGPHSALAGPAEQILSHYGIKSVPYTSMLVRNQSATDTALNLAAELFRRGAPISIPAANGDSVAGVKLLTDLPPYAWNHSSSFNAITRFGKEFYFPGQGQMKKSLLGSIMPALDEKERIWRGFIRLSEEPWLRDHKAGGKVLFPAAGMVSLAVEAAAQILGGKKVRGYRFRDVGILAAMVLEDKEETGTEVVVTLRPQALSTAGGAGQSAGAGWWEYTVSSAVGVNGQLRTNSKGLLSVLYEDGRSTFMQREDDLAEQTRIEQFGQLKRELEAVQTLGKQDFYERWKESGMDYGDIFQGIEGVKPAKGKATYELRVLDVGETFTRGKLDRPFLISPATLDAAWQSNLAAAAETDLGKFGYDKKLLLPTFIAELDISAAVPGEGALLSGATRSHAHGFNEVSIDVDLFDERLSRVIMSMKDLRLSQVDGVDELGDGDGGDQSAADPANITSQIVWDYDLRILKPDELAQVLVDSDVKNADDAVVKLLQLAIHQRPDSKVIELVHQVNAVESSAAIPKLPGGTILPIQVQFGVVDGLDSDPNEKVAKFGHSFSLKETPDQPKAAENVPLADIFVVGPHVSAHLSTQGSLEATLDLLFAKVKPAEKTLVAAAGAATKDILKNKGFDIIASLPAGSETVFLAKYNASKLTNGHTNGINGHMHADEHHKLTILEPATPSALVQSFSAKLQKQLKEQGYSLAIKTDVTAANPTSDRAVISLLELDTPVLSNLSEADFDSLKTLWVGCERLFWVTGDILINPLFGLVDGLSRVANAEVEGNKFQVLHFSDKGGIQEQRSDLVVRLLSASSSGKVGDDDEFREVGGLLQVPRLYKDYTEDDHIRRHLEDATRVISLNSDEASFRLTIGKPGLLDSLHFVRDEDPIIDLADNELEIEVKSTGLNFRDVMASMGLVPVTGLGQEASGIVIGAGKQASESGFRPGDRVSTLSMGGIHATKIRVDHRVTAKLTDSVSFAEGAAAPMVNAAAYYALVKLAKLRPGQSVLIHSAAGGLGQAAVQLAKHLDLVVYVTVGSETKRRLVIDNYGIPEDHIFNSRDASFARGIRRVTNGRGVDCVLNSLSGELLRESWTCLATFGTFVEVGVRDITDNTRLDMRPFSKSATFSSLDIPTLIDQDPASIGEALTEVFKLLQSGILHVPQPLTTYPVGQIEQAFRTMQQGKHLGKIVLSFDSPDLEAGAPVLVKAKDSFKLDSNATFLFVGGLGGLGRSLARQFVLSGARHLVFVSRSGSSKPEAQATVSELTDLGANTIVLAADVSDSSSFLSAMSTLSTSYPSLPPIKGVIQMAMVLRDRFIENMTYAEWTQPLAPKVQGTLNLHTYFDASRPLDFFLIFSSFSGVIGSQGQAQYAAGNTFQDALVHHRRSQGLPAVSLDLGMMLNVGVLSEMEDHALRQWESALGIREHAFHGLLKALTGDANIGQLRRTTNSLPAQLVIGLGTADLIAAAPEPNLASPPWFSYGPRFTPLTILSNPPTSSSSGRSSNQATASLSAQISSIASSAQTPEKAIQEATPLIMSALVFKTAEILRIPATEVDPSRPLYSYGVDSLVALEVRNWITREIKATMALLDILASVPMEIFAGQIAKKSKLVVTS